MATATWVEPEAPAKAPSHLHELLDLAGRAPGALAFARELLPLLARHFGGAAIAIELRSPTRVIHEIYASDASARDFWLAPLDELLTEAIAERGPRVRAGESPTGDANVVAVAAPVLDAHGSAIGALALALKGACDGEEEARRLGDEVFALAALIGVSLDVRPDAAAAPAPTPPGIDPAVAQALRKATAFGTALELCFSLANNLRNKSGCDRVALGCVRGRRVHVECISGLDDVPRDSPWARALHAALEECLDAGERLACPPPADAAAADAIRSRHRLIRRWQQESAGACVATLPLRLAGRTLVILALERPADRPFRNDELDEIQKLIEPYLAAIELIEHARGTLASHARRVVRDELRRLRRPRGLLRGLLATSFLALVGWVGFGSTGYEFSVPCRVRPAELRHVTAPFDGVLLEAPRRAGDRVRAGDLLARFDTRALELESARVGHELEEAAVDERRAFAARDAAGSERLRARADELRAQLGGVERRIADARQVAPFDGWILRGDLTERAGSSLSRGDELFQVAPDERVTFDLFVPEDRYADVRVGPVARFSPFARPEHDEPLTVTRIAPASEVHDGRNVFTLEAESAARPDWMRPGMEGVAVIAAGRRRVAWVVSHRFVDWVRLRLWP